MTHDAVLLERDLGLRIDQVPDRQPGAGEVAVQVARAGVCGSDLHVVRTGDWVTVWPAILGHEVSGAVLECPDGSLAIGQPVVLDSRVPCGRCDGCARAANLCEELAWLGECRPGGYQQSVIVSTSSVIALPPELPLDVAVLAEPLAVAQHAVNRTLRANRREAADCLIIGGGPIGQLVALLMAEQGRAVQVVEPDPDRRRLAESWGATVSATIPTAGPWHLVIDAAGYPGSLLDALGAAERGGVVTLVALAHRPVELDPADFVERETTLIGSSGFDDELPAAIALLAADPSRWRGLITETLALRDLPDRLHRWRTDPPTGKVVIRP